MRDLQTIQKTFRVFQILARVAFILTIVGASICAAGVLCCAVWSAGGRVFSLFGEPIAIPNGGDARQLMGQLIGNMIYLGADAMLLGFAGQYFRIEQAEGTPFTLRGADLIRRLGMPRSEVRQREQSPRHRHRRRADPGLPDLPLRRGAGAARIGHQDRGGIRMMLRNAPGGA